MKDFVLNIVQCRILQDIGLDMSDATLELNIYHSSTTGELMYEVREKGNRLRYAEAFTPTYTLQEVLEKLPKSIKYEGTTYCLFIDFVEGVIYYQEFEDAMQNILHENGYAGINLLDASYNMLCWVIENGYIENISINKK